MTKTKPPLKSLRDYATKRDFHETLEPRPTAIDAPISSIFVVQEHHATRLHYDFRLEAEGVLKSWAVTKEPSLDPAVKRLAIRVEDHPLSYAKFEGTIPAGHYGAGTVHIWDRGTFDADEPLTQGLAAGQINFVLHGEKLKGRFTLVRMRVEKAKKEKWLLIKLKDEFARTSETLRTPHTQKSAERKTTPAVTVTVAENYDSTLHAVTITHPEKILYPTDGIAKADVVAYYRKVAPRLLPFLKDRPMTLERLPDGLGEGKPHFWQKNTPASYPKWIPRIEVPTEDGKPVQYVLVNDLPTLLYLVNQGTLTFHPWLSRVDNLDRPDFVLFDLDVGEATFTDVMTVARRLRAELQAENHASVVKTSGKTGLHVLAPWHDKGDFDVAREWALSVAKRVADAIPETATVEIRKAKRGKRVYIDVLQNARGHHAVPPYVLRAVPGAPVSTPLQWKEVRPSLDPKRFTLRTAPGRFARQKVDPLAMLLTSA